MSSQSSYIIYSSKVLAAILLQIPEEKRILDVVIVGDNKSYLLTYEKFAVGTKLGTLRHFKTIDAIYAFVAREIAFICRSSVIVKITVHGGLLQG